MSDEPIIPGTIDRPDTKLLPDLKHPRNYTVLVHNDNFTPMEFVVIVLETVFHKTPSESIQIMLNAHTHGSSAVGVYTYEIAETKIQKAHDMAEKEEYPFMCTMEED